MKPRSIAVIGASQRMTRATRVVGNLLRFGYGGRIFPINPKYNAILGLPCFPDLASTPEPADSVVVAIPAEQVPGVLTAAVDSGVRAAVVLSSGFAEAGPAGQQRQAALERLAVERGLLICGPNCYGVFNIRLGAATFSADIAEPRPGGVAVVSQSGGFSHAIAEHLMRQRAVGLSYIVSCGNQAGLGVEDYVDFLVEDDDTAVIGVFVEGFKRPERLREMAARARARRKPVVVLKVGRSENARQAMLAHTGSLAGVPEIVEAVLKQSGLVQVTSLNEMIDTLALMAAAGGFARKSWRVAVLSGLGGECGNLSDVADRVGVELPPLAAPTVETLRGFMPDFANPRNPLDGTGAMYENPALFPRLIDVLLGDETLDVVAFNTRANVPAPGGWAPAREFARTLAESVRKGTDRLVLCFSSFAGGDLDPEVVRPLAEAGVAFLEGSETALLALRNLRAYRAFLDRSPAPGLAEPAPAGTLSPGARGVLAGVEAMRLLREFGIALAETHPAKDAEQAVRAAERVGYPVALKIDSPDIVHKTDVGGVRLGCADAAAVREGVRALLDEVRRRAPAARVDGVLVQRMLTGGTEMIVGVKRDPHFGPAIVCGFGGIFVELLRDVAVRVPPLDQAEALAMLAELRGAALLHGPAAARRPTSRRSPTRSCAWRAWPRRTGRRCARSTSTPSSSSTRGAAPSWWTGSSSSNRRVRMAYETILYEKTGPVATLTLNRPEALNAISQQMTAELHRALDEGDADPEVRAIILTGAGRGFSAGYDIARRPDGRAPLDGTGVEHADFIKDWWTRDGAFRPEPFGPKSAPSRS